MQPGRASRTAEGAAAARATHTLLDDEPLFVDPFALHFTSAAWRWSIQLPVINRLVQRMMRPFRPVLGQVVVRSRYAEDCLASALDAGVTQYVIVGAGFDSFACRRPDLANVLSIYELDHPDTQSAKRARIRSRQLPSPAHLHFVPVNFERETVADALARSDFNATAPAFFSWLGTTPYLHNTATLATLEAIGSLAASGSSIVFDYLVPLESISPQERAVMEKLRRFTDQRGEPLIGEFTSTELWLALQERGFESVADLSYDDQVALYFEGRADGLRPMATARLAHARLRR